MNLALSVAVPSALAGGEAIGGLSCARAPETISALTAADIIRVLSIVGLQASLFVKETRVSSLINNSPARGAFREDGTRFARAKPCAQRNACAPAYCWSMIFSENRCPLFGIML